MKTFFELRESKVDEISVAQLTKAVANSGSQKKVKKALHYDKTKKDLEAMRARLSMKDHMSLKKEAAEDNEPASPDEAKMAMKQLEFIEYAAEEIEEYIKSGKPFPEWMQNKLAKVHGSMTELHSYLGDHGGEEDEDDDQV